MNKMVSTNEWFIQDVVLIWLYSFFCEDQNAIENNWSNRELRNQIERKVLERK